MAAHLNTLDYYLIAIDLCQ
uniref:Uncharacterized protein n=1 Tax=Anguilla anguilla TaxID=7936 RepID=A0A0E9UG71_ANGAN